MKHLHRNLDKLFYYYSVAKNESFNEAARELNVSQPALSYAVRDLEALLSIKLLNRDRSGTRITPEGRHLLNKCEEIFNDLEILETQIANSGETPIGTIEFGTYDCYIDFFWTSCYPALIGKFPSLKIKLHTEAVRENIIEGLLDRKLDLAMVAGDIKAAGIDGCPLYHDSCSFFVSTNKKDTPWLKNYTLDIESLNNYPLIYERLDETPHSSNFFHSKLLDLGITAPPAASVRGIEVVKSLTLAGFGIGILPYWHAQHEIENKNLRELKVGKLKKGDLCPHNVNLFWHSSLTGCQAIQILKDNIYQHAKGLFPKAN